MSFLDTKLNTLLAVNEYKNFTVAARMLNLTQPAVSQHISQLEKEFDVKIFIKSGNNISLTSEGEILVRYARRLKSISKELDSKISEEKKEARILKIGITRSIEGNIIPEVLANIANKKSRTTIKITSDSIKNIYDKLAAFEIDLAVTEGKMPSSKFTKIVLDTDPLMVVLSASNPLANKTVITLKDIQNEKLILRSGASATKTLFETNLELNDFSLDDFNVLLEIDNTSSIKSLVLKNMGISVLPRSVCFNEMINKSLVLRPIQDMNMTTEINLVYNKNMLDESILEEIIKTYENIGFMKK